MVSTIKAGLYPFQGGPYQLVDHLKKIVNTVGVLVGKISKNKDGSHLIKDIQTGEEFMLVLDRDYFHILDLNDPDKNNWKIENYGLKFDIDPIYEYLLLDKHIGRLFSNRVFVHGPLQEPLESYVLLGVVTDHECGQNQRRSRFEVRIVGGIKDDEDTIRKRNNELQTIILRFRKDNFISITPDSGALIKYNRLCFIQDFIVTYMLG